MNHTPRNHRIPADRDADAFDAVGAQAGPGTGRRLSRRYRLGPAQTVSAFVASGSRLKPRTTASWRRGGS